MAWLGDFFRRPPRLDRICGLVVRCDVNHSAARGTQPGSGIRSDLSPIQEQSSTLVQEDQITKTTLHTRSHAKSPLTQVQRPEPGDARLPAWEAESTPNLAAIGERQAQLATPGLSAHPAGNLLDLILGDLATSETSDWRSVTWVKL